MKKKDNKSRLLLDSAQFFLTTSLVLSIMMSYKPFPSPAIIFLGTALFLFALHVVGL